MTPDHGLDSAPISMHVRQVMPSEIPALVAIDARGLRAGGLQL